MEENFAIIAVCNDEELNFKGNTAAVIYLEKPLTKYEMQQMASDFNQPATCFLWPTDQTSFGAAWFAPDTQIELCGHGSLAQAAWIGEKLQKKHVTLKTERAEVNLKWKKDKTVKISLEAIPVTEKLKIPRELEQALGVKVLEYYSSDNKFLVLLENENAVKNMKPDFNALSELKPFGYCVTAQGESADFVSRTLVPKVQQLEDHATGSSHAVLTPFWASRLNKNKFTAHQLSKRGGKFHCSLIDKVVTLRSNYHIIAKGEYLI